MANGSRAGAVTRAETYFDSGEFESELARRVAIKSESQKFPESVPECHRYLDEEMKPAFEAMGFTCRKYDNPFKGQGPVLLATRIEDPKLPTVLGYGHGDVVRGLEDQWTKGKGPWITARSRSWAASWAICASPARSSCGTRRSSASISA
jgi:acetylornithine deacetylase/succinyl-diaminopimelate desuccinylase-like protein